MGLPSDEVGIGFLDAPVRHVSQGRSERHKISGPLGWPSQVPVCWFGVDLLQPRSQKRSLETASDEIEFAGNHVREVTREYQGDNH